MKLPALPSLFLSGLSIIFVSIKLVGTTPQTLNESAYMPVNATELNASINESDTEDAFKADLSLVSLLVEKNPYQLGNPAGCSAANPSLSSEQMLAKTQAELGDSINLSERRLIYIWNGPQNSMVDVSQDPFVYEFTVSEYQRPFTYEADHVATTFMVNGFVVWFRQYGNDFRMLAIPMVPGVLESPWADYVTSYWESNGMPNDSNIVPVTKKLPCHWVVDAGYVTHESLSTMFDFNPQMPDFLSAGREYLASDCIEANRISQEEIGYWDAYSMCGPLAWRIMKDANAFPYRTGNWYADAMLFTAANPKWNGRPWVGFDPETYDVFHTDTPMSGYDFSLIAQLQPGDVIYSYASLYQSGDERFDHIFMVAGVDENGGRLSITNMVQNIPVSDCSIREVVLYAPGDMASGVIRNEWNSLEYGRTGTMGFDVFRWKWETYHLEGTSRAYVVRVGDTLETVAFDWKIAPERIALENQVDVNAQLVAGQTIILPAP